MRIPHVRVMEMAAYDSKSAKKTKNTRTCLRTAKWYARAAFTSAACAAMTRASSGGDKPVDGEGPPVMQAMAASAAAFWR